MSFDTFGLDAELLRTLAALNFTQPTPIQSRAIPVVLEGHDVQAAAQTGTGKTFAFALPMLHRFLADPDRARQRGRAPRALVLTPTRELAAQVAESFVALSRDTPLRTAVIFGGVGARPQIDLLARGIDILVATPGRLLDLCEQRAVRLDEVEVLVLDEADRMLDMGFIRDIRKVLAKLPRERQNLMFSATYSNEVQGLADNILQQPERVSVARNRPAELVTQAAHVVAQSEKRERLIALLNDESWYQVLVFTRTKHGANRLATQLERAGIHALAIHGNKSQSARTRALAAFKAGEVRVLVATDIAARGLDIPKIDAVVNFELPNVAEDYIHRIGRTGRAGASGAAVSLVSPEERPLLRAIEVLLKRKLIAGDAGARVDRDAPANGARAKDKPYPASATHPPPRPGSGKSRRRRRRGAAPKIATAV